MKKLIFVIVTMLCSISMAQAQKIHPNKDTTLTEIKNATDIKKEHEILVPKISPVYIAFQLGLTSSSAMDLIDQANNKSSYNTYDSNNDSATSVAFSWSIIGVNFKRFSDIPARLELTLASRGLVRVKPNGDGTYNTITMGNVVTSMLNGYFDFNFTPSSFKTLTPYITAGIGTGTASLSEVQAVSGGNNKVIESEFGGNFAWNIGAGMSYQFSRHWSVDFNAKYTKIGGMVDTETTKYLKLDVFDAIIGFRYGF